MTRETKLIKRTSNGACGSLLPLAPELVVLVVVVLLRLLGDRRPLAGPDGPGLRQGKKGEARTGLRPAELLSKSLPLLRCRRALSVGVALLLPEVPLILATESFRGGAGREIRF